MSHDVLLGSTARSWSRDHSVGDAVETPDSATDHSPLTEKEKDRIEKLARLEMMASNGNIAAQKKMIEINAAIATLQKRSKRGDAKSKRIISTLQDSGLIALSQSAQGPRLVMSGSATRAKRAPRSSTNPAQQVQQYLLNLKMRAMAGDQQSIAILQNYLQIVSPPATAQQPATQQSSTQQPNIQTVSPSEQLNLQNLPTEGSQNYPPQYPSNLQSQSNQQPDGIQPSATGSFVGFNGHLAFIRGLGEEEIALAREGGACERAALRRRY